MLGQLHSLSYHLGTHGQKIQMFEGSFGPWRSEFYGAEEGEQSLRLKTNFPLCTSSAFTQGEGDTTKHKDQLQAGLKVRTCSSFALYLGPL